MRKLSLAEKHHPDHPPFRYHLLERISGHWRFLASQNGLKTELRTRAAPRAHQHSNRQDSEGKSAGSLNLREIEKPDASRYRPKHFSGHRQNGSGFPNTSPVTAKTAVASQTLPRSPPKRRWLPKRFPGHCQNGSGFPNVSPVTAKTAVASQTFPRSPPKRRWLPKHFRGSTLLAGIIGILFLPPFFVNFPQNAVSVPREKPPLTIQSFPRPSLSPQGSKRLWNPCRQPRRCFRAILPVIATISPVSKVIIN
jgi:hypothetical protein